MFSKEMKSEIAALARKREIEPAALLAVTEVESGGKLFERVNGRNEPLIRFEGHYFHRLLDDEKRKTAENAGLASPQAGGIANPRAQAERWKLLRRARMIDGNAALCATSWGVGQVMGAHWRWLGFRSVGEMVETARCGLGGQVELVLRFIEGKSLKDALNGHDWAGFARIYNGPSYAKGKYHLKMASAWRRHAANPAFLIIAPLKRGDSGDTVLRLQKMLVAAGFPLEADGVFGLATTSALLAFQRLAGLAPDALAGPLTFDRLHQSGKLERKCRLAYCDPLMWVTAKTMHKRRMDRPRTLC